MNPISWEVRYWHSHDPPFCDWPRLSPPYLYAPIWVIHSTRRVSNRGTCRDLYPRAAPRLVAPMRAEHWIRSSPALRTFSREEIWFAIFFPPLWFSGVQSKVRYRHFHRPPFCDWPRISNARLSSRSESSRAMLADKAPRLHCVKLIFQPRQRRGNLPLSAFTRAASLALPRATNPDT